jgi:hypothetical protein
MLAPMSNRHTARRKESAQRAGRRSLECAEVEAKRDAVAEIEIPSDTAAVADRAITGASREGAGPADQSKEDSRRHGFWQLSRDDPCPGVNRVAGSPCVRAR